MQNIPRLYIGKDISSGQEVVADKELVHYLRHVMRRNDCLVFNNGIEYRAFLSDDNKFFGIGDKTEHKDSSNDIVFYFAPIKKTDEMLNMVTQLGVGVLQPVITARTVANHINWQRMQRIIIEASEQSGRNSIPKLLNPVKFIDVDFDGIVIADERAGHDKDFKTNYHGLKKVFVGPEGGFSPQEFDFIDKQNIVRMSLGKTILRAETAAVVAVSKIMDI